MMSPLDLVNLTALMERTSGRMEVVVGLIDGPVALDHPELAGARMRVVPGKLHGRCHQATSVACQHGTFVAGILAGKRGSAAPAICPGCTILVRPIFAETAAKTEAVPQATPQELAAAIFDSILAGAQIVNLSVALVQPSSAGLDDLEGVLDLATRRAVLVVAAAGNQGTLGSSVLTRHPWVIPVAACDRHGRPVKHSNLGGSIGRRGLSAPGDNITSLGTGDKPLTLAGTSAAAPFVTGALALLKSALRAATAAEVKWAVTQAHGPRRATVVPRLLDAWGAFQTLVNSRAKEDGHAAT